MGHQDIGGFQVAVYHQVAMRELHSAADLQEKPQPLLHAQRLPIAPPRDGLAIDEFHHQVRHALGRRAAIQQTGDVRVRQAGQDLPLLPEAS